MDKEKGAKMIHKQKDTFMIFTIVCLASEIAIVLYSIISMHIPKEWDAAFRGACYHAGWRFKDSGVILILTNVLVCAPIW